MVSSIPNHKNLRDIVFLLLVTKILPSFTEEYSGLLSNLYKEASDQNRPLIVVLDNNAHSNLISEPRFSNYKYNHHDPDNYNNEYKSNSYKSNNQVNSNYKSSSYSKRNDLSLGDNHNEDGYPFTYLSQLIQQLQDQISRDNKQSKSHHYKSLSAHHGVNQNEREDRDKNYRVRDRKDNDYRGDQYYSSYRSYRENHNHRHKGDSRNRKYKDSNLDDSNSNYRESNRGESNYRGDYRVSNNNRGDNDYRSSYRTGSTNRGSHNVNSNNKGVNYNKDQNRGLSDYRGSQDRSYRGHSQDKANYRGDNNNIDRHISNNANKGSGYKSVNNKRGSNRVDHSNMDRYRSDASNKASNSNNYYNRGDNRIDSDHKSNRGDYRADRDRGDRNYRGYQDRDRYDDQRIQSPLVKTLMKISNDLRQRKDSCEASQNDECTTTTQCPDEESSDNCDLGGSCDDTDEDKHPSTRAEAWDECENKEKTCNN